MTVIAQSLDKMTLEVEEKTRIKASLDTVFAALLEELGPANTNADGTPMPFVLEAWPGGRWFRDLGNNNGHLWGHVQAIKAPTLLEIAGPLMMSFAVASNLQYRLKEIDGGTLLTLRHTALGLFPDGYREALSQGWPQLFNRIRRRVETA
jgi:uncharacterized protein YndB with AHSA1/START domain